MLPVLNGVFKIILVMKTLLGNSAAPFKRLTHRNNTLGLATLLGSWPAVQGPRGPLGGLFAGSHLPKIQPDSG